jgi:hypothetical protein
MSIKNLYILSWIAFLAMIAANWAANGLPINGYTTGEISALYPNSFVPAGFTFSIWGLIYLSLLHMLIFSGKYLKGAHATLLANALPLFLLTCLLNISWIIAWHYLMTLLSVVIMIVFLATLALLSARLGIGLPMGNSRLKWVLHVPFSIYFGWITVASLANVTALLVAMDWGGYGLSEDLWAMILMVIAIAIALIMLQWRKDAFYALVVVWALFGIGSRQASLNDSGWLEGVALVALAGILVILARIALSIPRIKKVYLR